MMILRALALAFFAMFARVCVAIVVISTGSFLSGGGSMLELFCKYLILGLLTKILAPNFLVRINMFT